MRCSKSHIRGNFAAFVAFLLPVTVTGDTVASDAPPVPIPAAKPSGAGSAKAGSQGPPPRSHPQGHTTRVVQVSVVATDKHGDPVPDLKREDFRIFDEGRQEEVNFFSVDSPGVRRVEAASLPANTWTNRLDRRGPIPISVTIVLLDGLNTKISDQATAREQVVRALSTIQPGERVALYTLGTELRVIHDFTREASSLLAILARYEGYAAPATPETARVPDPSGDLGRMYERDAAGTEPFGNQAVQRFLQGADTAEAAMVNTNHALRTIDALEAIAEHVASIPGRKSLVWVSGGFPISIGSDGLPVTDRGLGDGDRNFRDELERAARALGGADIAVYPVSAIGVRTAISPASSTQFPDRRSASSRRRPAVTTGTAEEHALDTMIAFAERTGGRAFYGNNDIANAIHSAQRDSSLVYTLAYSPSHTRWDGRFRKIKVETRQPGVTLRFRNGYFAVPDHPLDERQRQEILAQAQWSPFAATEIVLTVNGHSTERDGKPAMEVAVMADAADLRLDVKDGRHTTDLILVACQKAGDGGVVDQQAMLIQVRMTEESYEKTLKEGFRVDFTIPLNSGASNLRIVLLDATDGRLGSVDVPLNSVTALRESLPGRSQCAADAERP